MNIKTSKEGMRNNEKHIWKLQVGVHPFLLFKYVLNIVCIW
jgi:hypothetical protein